MGRILSIGSLGFAFLALSGVALLCFGEQGDREERITLEGLLRFLDQFANQKVPVAMAIKAIEIHGLGFRPTPADLAKLASAGASTDLLKAIESARLPAVVAPVARAGRLVVGCRPVDCEVRINGKPAGSTLGGELTPIVLPEETLTVSATRRDYIPDRPQQQVSIRHDELARVEFHFTVAPEALAEAGSQLYRKMVAVAMSGQKRDGALSAVGTLHIHDSNRNPEVWRLSLKLNDTDRAEFEMARGKQRYAITRKSNVYKWRKRPRSVEAERLEEAARLILDYEYSNLLQMIAAKPGSVTAGSLGERGDEDSIVRVEGRANAYVILLDSDFRPRQITLEGGGINSGLKVLYSDFRSEGFGMYPRQMQIVLSGGGRQGIETRFDKLEVLDEASGKKKGFLKTTVWRRR